MRAVTEKHYERDFVCALERSELIGWLTDKDYSETTYSKALQLKNRSAI